MGGPKPGPYPMADRANIFGTLFLTFYDKWNSGGDAEACWPTFKGILNIARSKADEEFHAVYRKIAYEAPKTPTLTPEAVDEAAEEWLRLREENAGPAALEKAADAFHNRILAASEPGEKKTLTLFEMDEIVAAAWALLDRIRSFDYPEDEYEELVVSNGRRPTATQ